MKHFAICLMSDYVSIVIRCTYVFLDKNISKYMIKININKNIDINIFYYIKFLLRYNREDLNVICTALITFVLN